MAHIAKSLYLLLSVLCCSAATAETPDRAKAAKQAKTPGRCHEFSGSMVKARIDHLSYSYLNPLLPKDAIGQDDDYVHPDVTMSYYQYELQYLFKGKKIQLLRQCSPDLIQHTDSGQNPGLNVSKSSCGMPQGQEKLSINISLVSGCDFEKIELSTTLYVLVSEREQATSHTFTIPFNSQGKYEFEKFELEAFKLSTHLEREMEDRTLITEEAATYLQNNSKSAQHDPDDDGTSSNDVYKNGYVVPAYQNPSLKSYSQRYGVSDEQLLKNMDEQQKKALLEKIDKATSGYTYRYQHPGEEFNATLETLHELSYSDENDKPLGVKYSGGAIIDNRHIKTCKFDRPSSHLKLKITKYRDWKLLCIPLRVLIEPHAITVLED